jgi:HAD superfamily hydrolase (TIGR01509 family)
VIPIGVIFDWDGVVVDSSRLHVLGWQDLAQEVGRSIPLDIPIGALGLKTEAVITELLKWTKDPAEVSRLALRKEALFRVRAKRDGIESQPGVLDFLRGLHERFIPCVVGSSAPRLNVEVGMEALKTDGIFAAIVSGDDVIRGKPAPDIFLKAAEQMGRLPEECVVFEDAPVGVEAARSAGMRVVGVLTSHDPHTLQHSDLLIENFNRITVQDFLTWAEAARRDRNAPPT